MKAFAICGNNRVAKANHWSAEILMQP